MNKASGGDGIPAKLFQILKDGAVKLLHSTRQQIWKTQQQSHGLKKVRFHSIPKKISAKECSATIQMHSFHMLLIVRICSKSFKLG